MGTKIGIDVGGTFTDAVLIDGNQIEKKGKTPTEPDDLLHTIVAALDGLQVSKKNDIEQITVSTTLVTNSILQNKLPEVKVVLFPGSGMKLTALHWPVQYQVLSGELDYRGREVLPPNLNEWKQLADSLRTATKGSADSAKTVVAIISKFSHRNSLFEEQLANYLRNEIPDIRIALGSQWGQSNFLRRSLTTTLNAACHDLFGEFGSQLKNAVNTRGFTAPIRILKADGGVLPLEKIRPVESIYSGPAASVLGALAQSSTEDSYVVVDIGGTTTDIGIVLSGSPLISSRGAQIGDYLTNVRSMAVRSIPVGGDSAILFHSGELTLAPYRTGPAYCLGGSNPTPTDAMRFLKLTEYGSYARAEEAIANLLPQGQKEPHHLQNLATTILEQMASEIGTAIEELLEVWKTEPAYKVWQVLHPQTNLKFHIRMSGGAAPGIAMALSKRMNTDTVLVQSSEVSNAIGAAMAKPTFSWTLHLDTHLARYRIEETGEQGKWGGSKKPHKEVEQFLMNMAQTQAQTMGIEASDLQTETFDYFPLIDGYQSVGQIVRGTIYVPAGVTGRVNG